MTDYLNPLRCPVCGEPLGRGAGCLRCSRGHSYDLSRSGYVNLLPPGKGKNARTGDERDMVRARADFLHRGHYDPMDDFLAGRLAPYLTDGDCSFADMGAGEGHHTCRLAALLGERAEGTVSAYGFDASKTAAEAGCRLAKSLGLLPKDGIAGEFPGSVRAAVLPGNLFHLPLGEGTMRLALSLFAPVAWEEARRILMPGGVLAVVSSGRDHLIEMRRLLYDEVRQDDYRPQAPEGFTEAGRDETAFSVTLESREEIESLFMMTPFYYRSPAGGRERLLSRDGLTVTVRAAVSLFEV